MCQVSRLTTPHQVAMDRIIAITGRIENTKYSKKEEKLRSTAWRKVTNTKYGKIENRKYTPYQMAMEHIIAIIGKIEDIRNSFSSSLSKVSRQSEPISMWEIYIWRLPARLETFFLLKLLHLVLLRHQFCSKAMLMMTNMRALLQMETAMKASVRRMVSIGNILSGYLPTLVRIRERSINCV